jgi:hypothetical protein
MIENGRKLRRGFHAGDVSEMAVVGEEDGQIDAGGGARDLQSVFLTRHHGFDILKKSAHGADVSLGYQNDNPFTLHDFERIARLYTKIVSYRGGNRYPVC